MTEQRDQLEQKKKKVELKTLKHIPKLPSDGLEATSEDAISAIPLRS
jgi:hypothetical protein